MVEGVLAARADADDEEGEDAPEGDEPEEGDETHQDAADDRTDSTVALRDALKGAGRSASTDSVSAYRSKTAEAWKRPLTATK